MIKNITLSLFILFCASTYGQRLSLSTESDSAIYYYYEGWRQVMDEGDYTASEKAFRKMMTYDKTFLVGLSQLGRITRDLTERLAIETKLEKRKSEISGDEKLLLNNYLELVKLTNLRETDPEEAKVKVKSIFNTAEKNLQVIVHKYPDEIYYRAEYIEVLHNNYGPTRALDSLYTLLTKKQQNESFLVGYTASLEAEAGHFENASRKANELSTKFAGKNSPKPFVVYADVYFKMKKFEDAQKNVQAALKLDPGNIDAQRLEKKITEQLK
jgi:tetratricopeptide (TPR) repeat protein